MKALPPRLRVLFTVGTVIVIIGGITLWYYFRTRYSGSEPTFSDIFYTNESDPRRSLDIFLPLEETQPAPVVVLLHGGRGNKTDFRYTADQLTPHGFAVVLPSYRIDPMTYSDAFCALAWVHAHAEQYGLNMNRVYVIGWSSGGGIAAEMALVDNPNDLLEDCPWEAKTPWLQGAVLLAAGSDRWEESGWKTDLQPVTWIDRNEPPILLIHGEQDDLIPAEDSSQLASILESSGNDVQLLLLPEADHFFSVAGREGYDEMLQAVMDFLVTSTP